MAEEEYGPPERDDFLEEVVSCMAAAQEWRQQTQLARWQTADDLFNCKDEAKYTGTTRPNRSRLFIPVVYQQTLELIQEDVDAFDSIRPNVTPTNGEDRKDVMAAAIARELFALNLEAQDEGQGWFPFAWTSAHNAIVRGYSVGKWYWDTAHDRLGFDAIPLEDFFFDPRASLTRGSDWYIHRIFRTCSFVYEQIKKGLWKGKDSEGKAVDFDVLKAAATVENANGDRVHNEELDPYSQIEGREGLLELYEYYRRRGSRWEKGLTVKGTHTLEDPRENPDGAMFHPFTIGYTIPRAGHLDGESTVFRAGDLQIELNKNRNLDIDGRNRELDPKTIISRRAGLNLQQFVEGSEAVMSNRVGPDVIQEFKYSPTAQAMVPRDAITMRDIHGVTGRTPPTQGKAEGSVRGSQGIGILSQNARAPLTRRLKCHWQTYYQPGLTKAIYLIQRYETDEDRLMRAAQRAGFGAILGAMGAPAIMELLERGNYYVPRDPDMRMIDAEGYEETLGQMVNAAVQTQRTDVAMNLLGNLARSKGLPEIAAILAAPMNPAQMAPQGPGTPSPTPTSPMANMNG